MDFDCVVPSYWQAQRALELDARHEEQKLTVCMLRVVNINSETDMNRR